MRRHFANTLLALAAASFLGGVGVLQYYTRNRPSQAQPAQSRTVALQANYGKTVFVTEREKWLLYSIWLFGAAAAAGFVMVVYRRE